MVGLKIVWYLIHVIILLKSLTKLFMNSFLIYLSIYLLFKKCFKIIILNYEDNKNKIYYKHVFLYIEWNVIIKNIYELF